MLLAEALVNYFFDFASNILDIVEGGEGCGKRNINRTGRVL